MTNEQLMSTVREYDVPISGAVMPVIQFGSGPKVLAIIAGVSLCGLRGQGQGVAAAYADFADAYTVLLFDRRTQLPAGFQVQDMAEDVYAALCQLGVNQVDVYGCSQGGMIGLCLAIHHPDMVHSLSLCSSQSRAGVRMRAAAAQWVQLARARDVVGLNRCFFNLVYSPAYLYQFRDALPVLEKQGTPADCARMEVLAQACVDFDVYDQLSAIRCPVLLMGDTNDRVIGIDSTREIAAVLHCPMTIFTQYSHAVYDEAPQVKQRLLEFLTTEEAKL